MSRLPPLLPATHRLLPLALMLMLLVMAPLVSSCTWYRNHERSSSPAPAAAAPLVILVPADIDRWFSDTAAWRLPEEAFQFIDDLVDRSGLHAHVIASPAAVARLRSRLKGVFPSDALAGAELRGDHLIISFSEAQNRTIPTSIGQAGMALSQVIDFQVAPIPLAERRGLNEVITDPNAMRAAVARVDDSRPLRLKIVRGGVRINFTWILRMLDPEHLPDVQIDTIDIDYSPSKKSGYLVGRQNFLAEGSDLHWNTDGTRLTVGIGLPDLPWSDSVVMTARRCTFLGESVWRRIRPQYTWTVPKGQHITSASGEVDFLQVSGANTICTSEDPPPEVHAQAMMLYRLRRHGQEISDRSLQPGDVVLGSQPYPCDRIDACGLSGERADAALKDPRCLLSGGITASHQLVYEVTSGTQPSIDHEVSLHFLEYQAPTVSAHP